MANKKFFTNESLATLIEEIKTYTDIKVTEKDVFYVTVTPLDEETFSADKTVDEILEAVNDNRAVYCKFQVEDAITTAPLIGIMPDGFVFSILIGTQCLSIGIGVEYVVVEISEFAGMDNIDTLATSFSQHISNYKNPHKVTAEQVGLGNVDNTSDANKPVSTAQQEAINIAYRNAVNYAENAFDTLQAGYQNHTHTVSQITGLTVTATELNHIDGVTSNVQEQLDSKANKSHTHTINAEAIDDGVIILKGVSNGSNGVLYSANHVTSKAASGTYKSVTVDAYGHITGGTNPTTLAGYGITDAESKGAASSALTEAKAYADTAATNVKNDLLNGAGGAYDTLKELGDLIDENTDAIEALEKVAAGKADKSHTHDDKYYTKNEIDNFILITVDDIDSICNNSSITFASGVKF